MKARGNFRPIVFMQMAAAILFVTVFAACGPAEETAQAAGEAQETDLRAELAKLSATPDAEGAAWFSLAVEAREQGASTIAREALDQAQTLEYSPARIGLERARLAVLDDDPAAAVAELQALADGGFTAVAMVTADPLLSTLSGRSDFDGLVATLSEAAYPCEHQEKFREFDFWIGEWDVRDASGQYAGRNVIESAHRGCVLVENWTSATGGTGMSLNFFDHEKDEWVQVWVDGSGGQIEIRGGLTGQGMQLTGQIHYTANGTTAPFRGLWTELPDGRVRQFFEQSNDGGETWSPWFEGFYSRAGQ